MNNSNFTTAIITGTIATVVGGIILHSIIKFSGSTTHQPEEKNAIGSTSAEKKWILNNDSFFVGSWEGVGDQSNGTSWTIELSVNNKSISIKYPSLGCGGSLILIKETSNSLTLRERIEYGKHKCANFGQIILTKRDQNTLSFKYKYNKNQNLEASGILKRI